MRSGILTLCLVCCLGGLATAATQGPLHLVQTIPLDGVEGRIDHLALDREGQRLFLAALENHSVEVLDLGAGRRLTSLDGFGEPQGIAFIATPPRLFIADGADGSVTMLDADSLRVLRTIPLGDDADNVRVDSPASRVYVGYGSGGLAILDAATGETLERIALSDHPEAFVLERGGTRIFVNVPEAGEVAVVDRELGQVTAHWRLEGLAANFPLAFDATGQRLFVGCRKPARLLVLDAATGTRLGDIAIDGDVDDLFFDGRTQKLIASCGAGYVDVLKAPASGPVRVQARVPTAAGARTSLFDAVDGRLYVAVPHRGAQAAEVRVFEVAH